MLAVVRAAVQLGLEEREVGGVVGGDVPLGAVQQITVTVPAGGRLDRRHVGARALLGDRVALLALAPHGRAHVPLELVLGGHGRQPGRGSGGHPAQRVGDPPGLLLHQHLLQRGASAAAQFRGHVGGAQAQLAGARGVRRGHLGGQLATGQLGGDLERDQLVRERRGPFLQVKVGLGQPVHAIVPPVRESSLAAACLD